jgi:hypothetical protein
MTMGFGQIFSGDESEGVRLVCSLTKARDVFLLNHESFSLILSDGTCGFQACHFPQVIFSFWDSP